MCVVIKADENNDISAQNSPTAKNGKISGWDGTKT